MPLGETTYDGISRSSNIFISRIETDENGGEYVRDSMTAVTQYGSGQKWVNYRGDIEYILIVLVTPVTDEKVELRFGFAHKIYPQESYQEKLCRESMDRRLVHGGVVTDIPIMQFRKYFAQFYADGPYGAEEYIGETELPIS